MPVIAAHRAAVSQPGAAGRGPPPGGRPALPRRPADRGAEPRGDCRVHRAGHRGSVDLRCLQWHCRGRQHRAHPGGRPADRRWLGPGDAQHLGGAGDVAVLDAWIFYFNLIVGADDPEAVRGLLLLAFAIHGVCTTVAARWSFVDQGSRADRAGQGRRGGPHAVRRLGVPGRLHRADAHPCRRRHLRYRGRLGRHRRAVSRRAGGDHGQRFHQIRRGHQRQTRGRRQAAAVAGPAPAATVTPATTERE